ncbi:MAG: toll/interleukin-1 receptor domain-containing protein, partial [Anaerolineaceae bacterium]|nr:toll/interleukin-1 receptor domain-containing protein [Anaerolineaceae bacterium]
MKSPAKGITVAHSIFIDYSIKDKGVADLVLSAIESKGPTCWIAPRDIFPGSSWPESIVNAIETSKVYLLILSSNSNQSNAIMGNLNQACALNKDIVAFQIDQSQINNALSYYLFTAHRIEASHPPVQEDLVRLLLKLQELIPQEKFVIETHEKPDDMPGILQDANQTEDVLPSPWEEYLNKPTSSPKESGKVHDQFETLRQIHRSLLLSEDILRSDPAQLPGQLMGRLSLSNNAGVVLLLSSLKRKVQRPWLRPRQNCLPGPESAIIASWSVLDTVPPCRLVLSEDTKSACVVTQEGNLYWDLEAGHPLSENEAKTHFQDVNWMNWRSNLPERQFKDDQLMGLWTAATPPGPVIVSCSLDRSPHAFNRSFTHAVTVTKAGEERSLEKVSRTGINASEGLLAPALIPTLDKVICGGLGGEISIWDITTGSKEFTINIGNRTIISIAPYPDLSRCIALTLEGDLLTI